MVRHVSSGRLQFALMTAVVAMALLSTGESGAAAAKQTTFASPEAAADALVKASGENNVKDLLALFGPGSKAIVSSGDEVEDRQYREQFVKSYAEKHHLEKAADGSFTLIVGSNDWPMPIPIVKTGERWRFDTKAGTEEILCRRIGANELNAIQVMLAIADAEREFADRMRDVTGQPEYAETFVSGKDKKDGLYWETAPDEKPSPLGPLVARAGGEGYSGKVGGKAPYHGYLYRILKSQGRHAPGGAYSYVVNGRMIGGFALVAYPAVYRASGVHTFVVNYDGVVYGKNLGKQTAAIAASMTAFDPDETWKKME
jgi:hypothetical protein